MPHPPNTLAPRVTPLVFAAVFALGTWAEPIDLFGFWPGWATRVAAILGCISMAAAAVWPTERIRFAALAFGSWAALSRGLTILIDGQDLVPRKSEVIGGSIWMACSYLVLFYWIITVPYIGHDDHK